MTDDVVIDAINVLTVLKKALNRVSRRKVVVEWKKTLSDMIKLLEGDEVDVSIVYSVEDDSIEVKKVAIGRFVVSARLSVLSAHEIRRVVMSHLYAILAMVAEDIDEPELIDALKQLLPKAREVSYKVR